MVVVAKHAHRIPSGEYLSCAGLRHGRHKSHPPPTPRLAVHTVMGILYKTLNEMKNFCHVVCVCGCAPNERAHTFIDSLATRAALGAILNGSRPCSRARAQLLTGTADGAGAQSRATLLALRLCARACPTFDMLICRISGAQAHGSSCLVFIVSSCLCLLFVRTGVREYQTLSRHRT